MFTSCRLTIVNNFLLQIILTDATATASSLASLKTKMVLPYPGCPGKEAVQWV